MHAPEYLFQPRRGTIGLGSESSGTRSTLHHAWARWQALFNDAVAVASGHHLPAWSLHSGR